MKGSRGTTCNYPCSSSSPACPSSGTTGSGSTPTPKAGRYTRSSLEKRLASIRIPFQTTAGFPPNFSAPSGWLSTQESTPRVGHATKSWISSASRARSTSPPSNPKPIATSRGPRRLLATSKLGQLKFRELRDRAQKELGTKFDLRTFHDAMLDGGTLPLDLLDARTDKWIAPQKLK